MPSIADQLRAIANQLDATVTSPVAGAAPPDHVEVRPTGVHGAGKVRYYPDPAKVMNYAGQPVQTLPGYASQAQEVWRSPHFDMQRHGGLLYAGFVLVSGPAEFPAALDKLAYPDDWKDQATLDYEARLRERDRQIGATFSPR